MKLHLRTFRWSVLPQRIRGMFNLNDPRWGRGDDKSANGEKPEQNSPDDKTPLTPPKPDHERGQKMGANQGPPLRRRDARIDLQCHAHRRRSDAGQSHEGLREKARLSAR